MEEEDELLDYRSPKGKLIKLIEQKCKKPEIDNTLSEVLEKFSQLNRSQNTFLENGIFYTNFAENALFVQQCGVYYGKRVDKLWEDLLQFHMRLVKYDENHEKKINDGTKNQARQLELQRLEERVNRNKRKKITLVDPQANTTNDEPAGTVYVGQIAGSIFENEMLNAFHRPFELDNEVPRDWKELPPSNDRIYSKVLREYWRQKYRLKNYHIPGKDHVIYDQDDPEEFNTKQGRLPSYHIIRHLFEYNDRCLLPDVDNTIAKLRLAYEGSQLYFKLNNITLDTPYETYKADYERFAKCFFENESKKIQNMPQRDLQDLHKFYEVLQQKEKEALLAREKMKQNSNEILPSVTFESLILKPLTHDFFPTNNDPEECELDISQDMSSLSLNLDKSTPADKSRSDSGYFDGGFENDEDEDDSNNNNETVNVKSTDNLESAPNDENGNSELVQNDTEKSSEFAEEANLISNKEDTMQLVDEENEPIAEPRINQDGEEIIERMNLGDIDSFSSSVLEHSYFKQTKDMIIVVYEKDHDQNTIIEDVKNPASKAVSKKETVKTIKDIKTVHKEEHKRDITDEVPAKRRKLTAKQITNLKKSLIKPVNEGKWESFFSLNYQTEVGEGEIVRTNYESDCENEDQSDCEGSQISEHDYCRPDSVLDVSEQCNSAPLCVSESKLNDSEPAKEKDIPLTGDSGFSASSIDIRAHLQSSVETPCVLPEVSQPKSKKEIEREKMKQSVTQWKSYITPKLKELKEQDFDIHKYGSDIMDSMALNETKSFGDLVRGKSSAEVVRFFVSTLQLANTHNVEICGAKEGELSNETLALKLLSKERYHDHLDEYQAPSEESFREKLDRIRQIQEKENNFKLDGQKSSKHTASTSSGSASPAKKIKILRQQTVVPANENWINSQPSTSRGYNSLQSPSYSESHTSDEDAFFANLQSIDASHLQSTPRKKFNVNF